MRFPSTLRVPSQAGERGTAVTAWLRENGLLLALAAISFVGHMLVAGNYGYFRDELYYIADGHHLAFGYVDQPFLIGWLAALLNLLAGDNLVAIHVIPALAAGALVFVTGLIARELGGGRFAEGLAATAALFALVFLATGSIFSMDVLDELCWAIGIFIVVRLLRRDEPRLWLAFGLVAGIGLTAKLTMLFFGFALVIGLLLTPARRYFRSRWIWLGGAIAGAFLLPYIIWNALNGFPTWEFWHHYGGIGTGPVDFFANQILLLNPLALPLAVAGLVFYFRPIGKPYRALGWTFVVLYVVLSGLRFKPYFLPPAYPMLFAPGALMFERFFARHQGQWLAWLKPIYVGVLVLVGLLLTPVAMPVLPPATFVRDYGFLTGVGNGGAGQSTAGAFPQYLGDRFGWDTLTQNVAHVYAQLPPDQQRQACILAVNYGEASALNLLGPAYGLPPTISGHNNYYLWGPGRCSGAVLITVGYTPADMAQAYTNVVPAAVNTCAYCMGDENQLPILVCTHLTSGSLSGAWRLVKHYN